MSSVGSSLSGVRTNETKPITEADIKAQKNVLLAQTFVSDQKSWTETAGQVGSLGLAAVTAAATAAALPATMPVVAVVGGAIAVAGVVGFGANRVSEYLFSGAKTFAKILEEYAAAQKGIENGEQGAKSKAEKAKNALAERVASLTSTDVKDERTAMTRAIAAKELVNSALEGMEFDEGSRAVAAEKFSDKVGEIAVRKWVKTTGLNTSGHIDEMIQKQAEALHKCGYFRSVDDAKEAINQEYARFVGKRENQETADKKREALVEAAVSDTDTNVTQRFEQEKVQLKKLLDERKAFCEHDPEKLGTLQTADEKQQGEKIKGLRNRFPASESALEYSTLRYWGGTLGEACKGIRAQEQNIWVIKEKAYVAQTKFGALDETALKALELKNAETPKEVTSADRKQIAQWHKIKKELELLHKEHVEAVKVLGKQEKAFAELEKKYLKVQEDITKKEEILGSDAENPTIDGVVERIETEIKAWAGFLTSRLQEAPALSRGVNAIDALRDKRELFTATLNAIKACESSENSWDETVISSLRQIPDLFKGLERYIPPALSRSVGAVVENRAAADDDDDDDVDVNAIAPAARGREGELPELDASASSMDKVLHFLGHIDVRDDAARTLFNAIKTRLELRLKDIERTITRMEERVEKAVLV